MLKALFSWLDLHPGSYWLIALGPALLLLGRIGAAVHADLSGRTTSKPRTARLDALVLLVFLLACRWPFFLISSELNPDESQLIAGAITLSHDPVFWRAVDGTTSGPLNFYVLLPPHCVGLPLDYFTARLTGLLLIWVALFACQRGLAARFGRGVAWLGVLPATGFFATVGYSDLIHFSSEHLTLALIAVPCWLLAARRPGDRVRLLIACAVAGLAPWAKLQSVPIVLVLFGWAAWQAAREERLGTTRARRIGAAALAGIAPTLLAAALILTTGQAEAAVRRYFLHNLIYVGQGNDRTLWQAVVEMKGLAMLDGRFPLLLGTSVTIALAAGIYFLARRIRPTELVLAGSLLTLAAIVAVITPRREFLHYVLLLPVPLTLWAGAAAGVWWENLSTPRARWWLAAALLVVGLLPWVTRLRQPPPQVFGEFAYHWRHPRSRVASVVHALAGREGSLGVWGWAPGLYVETRLPQATRDAHTVWSILPSAQRDYHRADYLADLRHHQPAVFVDAVGPDAFAFEHRSIQAHEIFPELAAYLEENYELVRDVREARIYARRGVSAATPLSAHDIDVLLAEGRASSRGNVTPPPITPLATLTRKDIDGRPVMMVLPPTRVEWELDAETREVSFEFGFDPVAYEQGHSNGAAIILELVNPAVTRPAFRRLLDPARRPGDRGRQSARVMLPPFSPGTHLVLRTDPGEFGDAAWDWVYFADLQFRRSPVFLAGQFPGFSRVPDSVTGDTAGVLGEGAGAQLMLHAPGALLFSLRGNEQRLELGYGIGAGAYSDGGNTDGAVFRVELQRAGERRQVLFERFLEPVTRAADRGPQQATVILPALRLGDTLLVSTDPGPEANAAWDWTYISSFTLK